MKITSSKDLIMILLYARGCTGKKYEPIVGHTRLMKMIFLFNKEIQPKFNLGKNISDAAFPNFEPYDYGPYSEQVYVDLEFLVDMEFVKVAPVNAIEEELEGEKDEYEYWQAISGQTEEPKPLGQVDQFIITQRGKDFIESGELGEIAEDQWRIFEMFKERCTGIPLRALLRYVYNKYPEMTTKSKIKNKI